MNNGVHEAKCQRTHSKAGAVDEILEQCWVLVEVWAAGDSEELPRVTVGLLQALKDHDRGRFKAAYNRGVFRNHALDR